MKVFISWSGDTSKEIGTILRKYLPLMLQDVDAFLSRHDIESGARWAERIQLELEQSSYGLVLLTRSNLSAKWLLFEAGAISKLKNSATTCLLCGELEETDVTGPLAQFQFQKFERDPFFQLMRDMNGRLAKPIKERPLDLILQKWWPDIDEEYKAAILKYSAQETEEKNPRNEREFQDEILRMLQIAVKPRQSILSTDEREGTNLMESIWSRLSPKEIDFLKSVVDTPFNFEELKGVDSSQRLNLRLKLKENGLIFPFTISKSKIVSKWKLTERFARFVHSQIELLSS
ncbi:MAG: toll/interleukin-1 receptor domain-containing protein [Pirellulales bacterium]